jgi:hypothetical protein
LDGLKSVTVLTPACALSEYGDNTAQAKSNALRQDLGKSAEFDMTHAIIGRDGIGCNQIAIKVYRSSTRAF